MGWGGLDKLASAATGGAIGGKAGSKQVWGTSINQDTTLGSLASPAAKLAALVGTAGLAGYGPAAGMFGGSAGAGTSAASAGAAGGGGAAMAPGAAGAGFVGQSGTAGIAGAGQVASAQAAGLGLGAGGIYGATGLTGGQLGLGLGGIGAALYGTQQNKSAMDKASAVSSAASQGSTALQGEMFNQTQANQRPWLEAGQRALTRQEQLMNDPSSYQQDPYNKWLQEQGQQGIERSAAARGMIGSGNLLAELARYNQGMAGQGYGDQYNRWAGLSGTGQTSANTMAGQANQYAQNVGNLNMQNAQMQGNLGMAQAGQNQNLLSSLLNTGAGMYGMSQQNALNQRFYDPFASKYW